MDRDLEKRIGEFMARELAQGKSLSEIQALVNSEFEQNLTYMDIRIMASTLEVDWKALDPRKPEAPAEPQSAETAENEQNPEAESDADIPQSEESSGGATVVEINKLARPGMMFSGSVKFANGATAEWYVDTTGRLGLENLVGDKPSQSDIEAFQVELDKNLRKAMGR